MVLGRSHRASHLVLRSVVVSKSNTSLTDASFRVRLFSAAPVLSGGDNSALTGNLASLHRGSYSTVMDTAYVDGAVGVAVSDSDIPVSFDEPMWALLEARAAYPENASETFRLWFELAQPD